MLAARHRHAWKGAGSALSLLAGLSACAHLPTGELAEMHTAIVIDLAPQQLCLRLPDGRWAEYHEYEIVLEGSASDGRSLFPDRMGSSEERIRQTFDLLSELGLFTAEEVEVPPVPRRQLRYRATMSGMAYYRFVQGGHGETGWYGLCYGGVSRVELTDVEPLRHERCQTTRRVSFTYRYRGIPEWTADPRLAGFFPELAEFGDETTSRRDGRSLVLSDGHWYVQQPPSVWFGVTCIGGEENAKNGSGQGPVTATSTQARKRARLYAVL